MNDRVSVIMPWFDTNVDLVNNAIKSVANQTYKNVELVICNDGSDHKKSQKVKALIEQYDLDITYIAHNQNKGLSNARNTAVSCSCGKWLVWLDSDDMLSPNCVEELISEVSKGYLMTIGECVVIEGNTNYLRKPGNFIQKYKHHFNTILDPFLLNIFSIQPQILLKDAFLGIEEFCEDFLYAELTDFFLRFASRYGQEKISFGGLAKYIYNRNSPNSMTKNREVLFHYRKQALLAYKDRQKINIEDIVYLGRISNTGIQTYAPIKDGVILQTPYYFSFR